MFGVLTIDTTNFGALTIKRNDDANSATIQFRGKSNIYGYIGLNNSTKDKQFLRWNSDTSRIYTILDTSSTYTANGKGVINGTTITQVDNATNSTNSTNARKLVNWYSARPTSLNAQFGDGSLRIFYATSSTTVGKCPDDATVLHLAGDNNGGLDTQLALAPEKNKMYFRGQNKSTWQSWKTLAFTSDNVASASKLQTARSIWGQSFDGTRDVNGTIYINNSDSKNGAIILNNNVNTHARISAIEDRVIFNTGNAIRFGETDWDYDRWAGLKYTHSNKTIYLGIADGSVFKANSAQSNGTLKLPGITTITTNPGTRIGNSGGELYLGNDNNSGFVRVQDICSQMGTGYWHIYQYGDALFNYIKSETDAYIVGNLEAGQIIREGSSQNWINGRNGALLRETSVAGYHTLWSLKTTDGSWDFGEFNAGSAWNNIPVLSYITDSNYNSGNNVPTYQIKFPLASGTVALTSQIGNYYWANVKISASANTQTQPSVNTIYANNWFRSQGASGWRSESYGGGIWMNDSSWIRTYGGKSFYCDNQIYSSNSIRMSNILLENTDEINNITDNGGLHLNYRNPGKVSLCVGGGNVGIGTVSPVQKLDVNGQVKASGFHHSLIDNNKYILLAGGGYNTIFTDVSYQYSDGEHYWLIFHKLSGICNNLVWVDGYVYGYVDKYFSLGDKVRPYIYDGNYSMNSVYVMSASNFISINGTDAHVRSDSTYRIVVFYVGRA